MDLRGKTAVVTGGARRLGRAMAFALAEAGANVVVHYGSSADEAARVADEIVRRGVRVTTVRADLRDPVTAARAIMEHADDEFGAVEILVNSAAIFEPGTLDSTTSDHWRRHFAINLEAPFWLCQEFARRRVPGRRAHVVNIADWRALRPGTGHLAYTLTKSALVALTLSLAQELAPEVQVNAIAPGPMLPPPGEDQAYLRRVAEEIPLRRPGSPEEVAAALLYLLRSDFATGEILHVTGGEHL